MSSGGAQRGLIPGHPWTWAIVPATCLPLLLLGPELGAVHGLVLLFVAMSAASLLLRPRGFAVARTWVVGYLLMQFPIRALFLLTAPKERPPLYAELSPGVGLEPALVKALAQSCVGLAVMLLVCCLVPNRAEGRHLIVGASIRLGPFLALLGAAALLLPIEAGPLSRSTAGGGFILGMPGLAASGAAAAVCYCFVTRPREHVVAAALAITYAMTRVTLLHSKLALLSCLVAAAVGFAGREQQRRRGRAVTVRGTVVLVGTVLAALGVFAVSSGRNQGQDLTGALGQGGAAVVSRSYGVDALIASNQHLAGGGEMLHGSSLTELATSWIPRQLWPDKPRSFSIRFGEDVFSFSHSVGNEFFAPSYSGEWVLNFGFPGLLVGWALFGVAIAKVDGIASLGHRMLWLVPVVHMVEGSVVAQLWLALPFVVGGYYVLQRPDLYSDSTRSPLRRLRVSKT